MDSSKELLEIPRKFVKEGSRTSLYVSYSIAACGADGCARLAMRAFSWHRVVELLQSS